MCLAPAESCTTRASPVTAGWSDEASTTITSAIDVEASELSIADATSLVTSSGARSSAAASSAATSLTTVGALHAESARDISATASSPALCRFSDRTATRSWIEGNGMVDNNSSRAG